MNGWVARGLTQRPLELFNCNPITSAVTAQACPLRANAGDNSVKEACHLWKRLPIGENLYWLPERHVATIQRFRLNTRVEKCIPVRKKVHTFSKHVLCCFCIVTQLVLIFIQYRPTAPNIIMLNTEIFCHDSTVLVDLGRFFSFFICTQSVGPWTVDKPVARPLPTHRTAQTQNKRTKTSKPWVGLEPTTSVFEWAKTVHATAISERNILKLQLNSMAWVRKRTIPTDWATAACRRS
jgi:hypothetical protein